MPRKNCGKCGKTLDGKNLFLCKECAAESARVWYYEHKEDPGRKGRKAKYAKEYYQRFTKDYWNAKISTRRRERRLELRTEILNLLENKCALCSFADERILEIDHINGGGRKELREFRAKSWNSYLKNVLESIKRGEKKYRLLCPNCNRLEAWKREHETP